MSLVGQANGFDHGLNTRFGKSPFRNSVLDWRFDGQIVGTKESHNWGLLRSKETWKHWVEFWDPGKSI